MTSLAASPRAGAAVAAGERTTSRTWAWLGLAAFVLGVSVTWVIQFLISQGSLEAGGQVLIDDLEIPTVNELFIHTQPAHLQKLRHERLESAERNVVRASYIRQRLSNASPSNN